MKIVFAILFFTFVVFFNSIEVSLQSHIGGTSEGGGSAQLHMITHWEVKNPPLGHRIILPNGHAYQSTGTGDVFIDYTIRTHSVKLWQKGRPVKVFVGSGPYSDPSSHPRGPGVTVIQVNFRN